MTGCFPLRRLDNDGEITAKIGNHNGAGKCVHRTLPSLDPLGPRTRQSQELPRVLCHDFRL